METALELVRSGPPGVGLAVIFAAAAAEYLLPPLPADSVLLAGALLVLAGVHPFLLVWAVAVAGGAVGMTIHHRLGWALRRPEGTLRGSAFVDRWLGWGAVAKFQAAVRRYGAGLLLINRALPGIRGAAFVAVGAAGLPLGRCLALGLVSHGLWSLGILALGVWIGDHWDRIEAAFRTYRTVVYVAGSFTAALAVLIVWKRRRDRR